MNNIDLNINNYSYEELLHIFKTSILNEKILNDIRIKISTIKNEKYSVEIYNFFVKIEKILASIYYYNEMVKYDSTIFNSISNEDLYNKILNLPGFENQELNKIYKLILSDNNKIINTFENNIVPGIVNPIKRIIQLYNLHLNSCFRDNYYTSNSTNFNYTIPDELNNVVSLKLVSIELPNAWYLYSNKRDNNKFKIEITNCEKCNLYEIIIPDGNYNIETLQTYLNTTYFSDSDTLTDLKFLKFTISPINNKSMFKLIPNVPEGLIFSLHFNTPSTENIMETLGWSLGFRMGKYLNIDDVIQSESLYDAGGDQYIYISINDYIYNYNKTSLVGFDKTLLNEPVIAKIPMNNGKLALIVNENEGNTLSKLRRYNGPVNLRKLEIKLLDKYGNIIELNNMDYSLSLELEILYERNNIS